MKALFRRAFVTASILAWGVATPANATLVNYDAVIDLTNILADYQGFSFYQAPLLSLNSGDQLKGSITFANGQSLRYVPGTLPTLFVGLLLADNPSFSTSGSTETTLTGLTGSYNGQNPGTGNYFGGSIAFGAGFGANSDFQFTGIDFSTTWTGPAFTSQTLMLQSKPMQIVTTSPAVPEPATWAMMLTGFGAVGYAIRRRSRKAATPAFA